MELSSPCHEPQVSRSSPASAPPTVSSSAVRLWRPAAQRNLRNQWLKLAALCQDWRSTAAGGRSHATSVVNSYLSQMYMDGMDFGVLSDMPNIRKKACHKLFKQQELYRDKLLASYRNMVAILTRMVDACKSMRCYFRSTSSNLLTQFSFSAEDSNDSGDCGGIPVFTFYSIASFEEMAWEIVQMFKSELNLKRLLVMNLLSIYDKKVAEISGLHWSDELYEGEFDDLGILNLYSKEFSEPVHPYLRSTRSSALNEFEQQEDSSVLQVYLTTWLAEVNIDSCRVDEIFGIVGEEMHVKLP